jgi:hypothetical protein
MRAKERQQWTRCNHVRPCSFSAYGLRVQSAFEVPIANVSAVIAEPDLLLRLAEKQEIVDLWSVAAGAPVWQATFPNHHHVRCERGQASDHLISFGREASFHLDPDAGVLLCAPEEPQGLSWQRFLLDTVLQCVSLIRGFEALHASAVSAPEGIAAFVAAPGGGKSALAAELVRRGHSLFSDDVLALSPANGEVLAHAGPPLMTFAAEESAAIDQMGDSLGVLPDDGTSWVRIRHAGGDPQPLAKLFVLDRRRGEETRAIREPVGGGRLLPHMLSLNRDPARALSRSGLLSELMGSVPVYRLETARDDDLSGLAAVVEDNLKATSLEAEPVA